MRLIDADMLCPDCLTKQGKLAISQSQIANAPTVEPPEGQIEFFKRMVEKVRPQGEWIPVSERLPNDLEPVNITWINHDPDDLLKE